MYRGSRKHVLDWVEQTAFLAKACVGARCVWLCRRLAQSIEWRACVDA